jgi:putative cell wall-binding protein
VVSTGANGAASVTTNRLGGPDRYATANAIALDGFTQTPLVLLARGDAFPDALAGNFLAGAGGGPVLLTQHDVLSPSAADALSKLKTQAVVLLGGPQAISGAVEQQVKQLGAQVIRLQGVDRYATAASVATSLGPDAVFKIGGLPTAIIASGEDFPDALAGGPMAWARRLPVLLTTSSALPGVTDQALNLLGIKQVLLLGGNQRIGDGVAQQLTAKGIAVQRLAGANRQQTAVAIAAFELAVLGFDPTHAALGRGDVFADPLSGGPNAGKHLAPILLTDSPTSLGESARMALVALSTVMSTIDGFGGTQALSDGVLAAAKAAATCKLLPGGTLPVGGTLPAGACPAAPGGLTTLTLPGGLTLPTVTLPVTLPTLPITLPTLPGGVTIPTLPITLPTLPGGTTLPTLPITIPTIPGPGGVTCPPLPQVFCQIVTTLPPLPTTVPTLPVTVPTLPVTLPTTTLPVTLPTLPPVTLPPLPLPLP